LVNLYNLINCESPLFFSIKNPNANIFINNIIMKKLFTKLTLLFIVLALSPAIQSQMILEYNLELSSGTTITLPLYGTVNVTVDWGDGNTEPYTTTGNKNHTYATGGTKAVSISGSLTQFGSGVAYNNADKLVRVTSFGNLGLTSL